jgi:hypothetical protein
MSTYKEAGVDIDAGDRAVELMKASIAKATRPEVLGGIGGFAGLFDASALKKLSKPLLATSTDGVGTKTEIARQMGIYDTIGEDLVAMVVDDLVVCGAEPLFMTDYIAVGKVVPERIADIVKGIARGCEKANTALIGGETAEHPGLLKEDEFDIAGAAFKFDTKARRVLARSSAGIPVERPAMASTVTVNAVVWLSSLRLTIRGSFNRLAVSAVMTPQITPEVYRTIKPIFSALAFSAKRIRSASFSRFSSSVTTINLPALKSLRT